MKYLSEEKIEKLLDEYEKILNSSDSDIDFETIVIKLSEIEAQLDSQTANILKQIRGYE
jgi:succinate dehydrogenase flavin-adding protein (antitoxin of CptAB toxin-antitoxin module)